MRKITLKSLLIIVVCNFLFIVIASDVLGSDKIDETPFSTAINKLWRNAEKKNVSEIGNKILKKDPQNIIGLLIKMEYDLTYLKLKEAQKTAELILKNIKEKKYTTKNMKKSLPLFTMQIQTIVKMIPLYPEEEKKADLKKANLKGKDLSNLIFIKAAEKDGLLPEGIKYPQE